MVSIILAVIAALAMGLLFAGNILFTVILAVIAVGAWFLLQRTPKDFLPAQIEEAPIARFLFASGQSLLGFWKGAIENASGAHPSVGFDWYAGFLQALASSNAQAWFGPLIAVAEAVVGVCLILGLFTGIAAFGAAFMNLNYMLAGSAGVNPVYFLLGLFLILAWRNAGWIGLDRWLLPRLGAPWHPHVGTRASASGAHA